MVQGNPKKSSRNLPPSFTIMARNHMLEDNAMTNNTIIKNNEKLIRLFFIPFSSCRILETRSSFDTSGHL
jgi:hypothetical protein